VPNGSLTQLIISNIMRNVPVGFNHQRLKQESTCLDHAIYRVEKLQFGSELIPVF